MRSANFAQMPWRAAGPKAIPQAFPYQGSKRLLASQILSLFPERGVPRLVEPFAGSAAISLAARNYGLARSVALSDVNEPLMDLWKLIVEKPLQLIEDYTRLWTEQISDPRAYYLAVRDEFNVTHDPALLLYLLCRCVKAAVRYSRKTGGFNQGADHRRLGARPENIAARVKAASELMQGAEVLTCAYEKPLVSADVDELVYLDPPYQGTSDVPDHRYLKGLRREVFVDTLQRAVENNVSFVVSYDAVTEDNRYGYALPEELGLLHRHVVAGLSSQATLMGKSQTTVESLYISPALVQRLGGVDVVDVRLGHNVTQAETLF
ncbi:DNA adenine methylase [Amycolatopsis sp. QT-25]|uniref:DNA adenine methylase n=1 Tax=Amycolatopsis sp. QT-25 TaxID=3034022 RepID=UPI0023EC29AF|nr:DNA adenine methylase [Amycolatopsis sp. QT-25]WET78701.1 DNA adenine methylase [Amycolatopsis sp. QT-25]